MRKFNLQRILIFSAGWILLAFLFSGLSYFATPPEAHPRLILWRHVFLSQAIIYSWAILSPLIIFFAKRFRFSKRNWWRLLPAHFVAAVVFLLLHTIIHLTFVKIVNPGWFAANGDFWAATLRLTIGRWQVDLPTYCFLLSCFYVVDYYRNFQAEQLKSSELKAALATSQLNALKMQIHPHFLFNTLNAISALVNDSPKIATQTIAQLSDLLRMSLKSDAAQEISLKQELDFLGKYVQIQQTLLQDRLGVEWKIAPETLDAAIPNMILQPLVENAINHGISPVESGGCIVIAAAKENENLKLSISDNGQGLPSKAELLFQKGIGLYNTRERLKHLYGGKQEFMISEISTGGVLVQLEIPFRELIEEDTESNENSSIGR
ncbi:MAG TPA: histidine kinase [Pyrinomonadaceae bacterium]|jgi:signal transduction histidine kinase